MKREEHLFEGVKDHRDCLADAGNPDLCLKCGMSWRNPIHMEMQTDGHGNVVGYVSRKGLRKGEK